jgi:hypothetical protein
MHGTARSQVTARWIAAPAEVAVDAGQTRTFGDAGSMSDLPTESGHSFARLRCPFSARS